MPISKSKPLLPPFRSGLQRRRLAFQVGFFQRFAGRVVALSHRDDAGRFEFGTMAYGCALGLAEAIKFILSLGVDAVCAHDFKLRTRLAEGLKQRGAQLLSPVEDTECSPIVSARFAGFSSRRLVDSLRQQDVIVSPRADFVRFSPHLYNSSDDIDHALEVLDRALAP